VIAHQRRVASIALAVTADRAAGEDAAQEAFLQGWRDLPQLSHQESFSAWICRIARNRAHDAVRRRQAGAARFSAETSDQRPPPTLTDAEGSVRSPWIGRTFRDISSG
jgi:RNA polymerase sigma factor (sigma-70 family)